jgi:hypothetical protein
MQGLFTQLVAESLSEERLSAYRYSGETHFDALLRYMWNAELGAALYTPLQHLEIALRNAMHQTLASHYGSALWFDGNCLTKYQTGQVAKARGKLQPEDHKRAGKIVAELEFGFWTALFYKSYAASLVPVLLNGAFGNVVKPYRDRGYLAAELNNIRKFRNRVFHHEPIWKRLDILRKRYSSIMQLLLWLNPSLFEVARITDRFPEVYRQGTAPYKSSLLALIKD